MPYIADFNRQTKQFFWLFDYDIKKGGACATPKSYYNEKKLLL